MRVAHHVALDAKTRDEMLTADELIRFWQDCDELSSREAVQQRRPTPPALLVAWGLFALLFLSILTAMPSLLRAVGSN